MKNENEIGKIFAGDSVAADAQMGAVSVNTHLNRGDEVYAMEIPRSTGHLFGDNYCSFSGVLLSV